MSRVPTSILSERVTSVRSRLVGSMMIVLVALGLAVILYAVVLARLDRLVLVLAAGQPPAVQAEVESVRYAMRLVSAVWLSIVVVVLMGATLINIRGMVQPVERLTEAASRLAAGHLDERIRVEWTDEFGRLGEAFNQMADQLQITYTELEQRVAERTRNLERNLANDIITVFFRDI